MFKEPYAKHYEKINKKKQYKKEINFVYEWGHNPKRILDLGCGTAGYWKHFPEKVQVHGVEKSKDMIDLSPYKRKISNMDVRDMAAYKKAMKIVKQKYDMATALFDVIGYLDRNDWWKDIPLKENGYFIFDIWDKKKVVAEGFTRTIRVIDDIIRIITPKYSGGNRVQLTIDVMTKTTETREIHEMFLYDDGDVFELAGDDFDIVDVKETEKWQKWYKLKRR